MYDEMVRKQQDATTNNISPKESKEKATNFSSLYDGKFVFSPILSSSTGKGYLFKVYYKDGVDLRVIKDELISILRRKHFEVEDQKGWHEHG